MRRQVIRALAAENRAQVRHLYAGGMSVREIEARLGLTYSTVRRILAAGSVEMRRRGVQPRHARPVATVPAPAQAGTWQGIRKFVGSLARD